MSKTGKTIKKVVSALFWDGTAILDKNDGMKLVNQRYMRRDSVMRGYELSHMIPEDIILAHPQEMEFEMPELEFEGEETNVTMGVGDSSGLYFVKGKHETIKLLQTKILRAEKIEAALVLAILTLNDIPNQRTSQGKTYEVIKKLEEALGMPGHEWTKKT